MASQTGPSVKMEGPATVKALVEDDEETTRDLYPKVAALRFAGLP
jgi:hypothetical protein